MNWGMGRSSKEGPCQEEAGWPLGKMVVVVVVVVVEFSGYPVDPCNSQEVAKDLYPTLISALHA